MGEPSGSLLGPVTQSEREFNRLNTEYRCGSVWTEPGLKLDSRSICTLSQEQIAEVFIHTTSYCRLPFTRAAIDQANEIFRGS